MKGLIFAHIIWMTLIFSCQKNKPSENFTIVFPTSWEGLRDIRVSERDSHNYGLANSFILKNDSIIEFHYPFTFNNKSKITVNRDSIIKESSTERIAMKWDYTDSLLTINSRNIDDKGMPTFSTATFIPKKFNSDTLNEILDFGFAYNRFMNTEWYFYEHATEMVNKDSLQMERYNLPKVFKPIDLDHSIISQRKIRLNRDTFFLRHYLGTFMSLDLLNLAPVQYFLFQDSLRVEISR